MKRLVVAIGILVGVCGCLNSRAPGSGCSVTKKVYGHTPDGEQVDLYTVSNGHGLEITVMTLGATLTTVKAHDRDGKIDIITLHKESFAEYVKGHPLFGSVVGRYANRIANASFTIDGTAYKLEANAKQHHIHGGGRENGFAWQVWQAEPIRDKGTAGVRLTLNSPDGQAGFPGNLRVTVDYKVTTNNRLIMDYTATTDKPTHVNLTNHAYWNLCGADSGHTVMEHRLTLNADRFLAADKDKMPTGEITEVEETPMDFRTPRSIGSLVDKTDYGCYDHCYVLNRKTDGVLSLCARVEEPRSGRVMTVWTTQPGVQLYTGNKNGLCLETQHFPNSPNEPAFPSTLLRPGETFRETTMHAFDICD